MSLTLDTLNKIMQQIPQGAEVRLRPLAFTPLYGVVTIGNREYEQTFHNEEELTEILTRFQKGSAKTP